MAVLTHADPHRSQLATKTVNKDDSNALEDHESSRDTTGSQVSVAGPVDIAKLIGRERLDHVGGDGPSACDSVVEAEIQFNWRPARDRRCPDDSARVVLSKDHEKPAVVGPGVGKPRRSTAVR